jgi:hypothetical protein
MRVLRALTITLLATTLSACLTSTTSVKVKPDGSGTIETTTTIAAAALAQLKTMMSGFGGKDAGSPAKDLFSEADLRRAATKMGEGVTFVSSTPIKTAEAEGVRAVYAFTDVSKLRLSQTPSAMEGASGMMGRGGQPAPAAADDIRFRFAREGGTSVVTLLFPEPKPPATPDAKPAQAPSAPADPAQLEMIKTLFAGLHIDIGLDVDGRIIKTNAPYVTGNRVTLVEMDFSQLMNNPTAIAGMQSVKSIEDAKTVLKGMKGVKVNLDREVRVEFVPR